MLFNFGTTCSHLLSLKVSQSEILWACLLHGPDEHVVWNMLLWYGLSWISAWCVKDSYCWSGVNQQAEVGIKERMLLLNFKSLLTDNRLPIGWNSSTCADVSSTHCCWVRVLCVKIRDVPIICRLCNVLVLNVRRNFTRYPSSGLLKKFDVENCFASL